MRSGRHRKPTHRAGSAANSGSVFTRILAPALLLLGAMAIAAPVAAAGSSDRSFTPRSIQMKVTQVRSGDEIQSGGFKVRLAGIAAPPFGTALGNDAVRFLNTLILNRNVGCRLTGRAFRDQEIGTCRIGGRDIAELLVREGLALPCARLGGRRYEGDVRRAKDTGIADAFDLPRYCGAETEADDEIPRT